jgi:hypothetical protein
VIKALIYKKERGEGEGETTKEEKKHRCRKL